jgi:gliding motility-associated-like protein
MSIGCTNDDDSKEPESKEYLCCGINPFLADNLNNLDPSAETLQIPPVFTPNQDAINDKWVIENITSFNYNIVTVYNLNDELVLSIENYDNENQVFGGSPTSLESGTYKYKIVLENDQTFVEYGYVCLVKTPQEGWDFYNATNCSISTIDPVLI